MASPEKTISNQTNAGPKGMEWKKGIRQGPVDKLVKNLNELVVFDVRNGRVVEEESKKPVKPHPGEARISLRAGR